MVFKMESLTRFPKELGINTIAIMHIVRRLFRLKRGNRERGERLIGD